MSHIRSDEFLGAADAHGCGIHDFHRHSRRRQLGDDRAQMRRRAIGDREVAVGDSAGDEEGAGFDAVRNDGVSGAVKLFNAADFQGRGAIAVDVRAHFAEEMDEIGDFRLAGAIFERGDTVGEGGGHEDIFRAGHGDFFENDVRAFEAAAVGHLRLDVTVFGGNVRTHFFERNQVQIHGPCADGAAARQGDVRHARAGDGGPKREDGSAHGFDKFVGGNRIVEGLRFDGVSMRGEFRDRNFGRHERQQFRHGYDVAHLRDVMEDDRLRRKQGGGHQRQGRVLGAGDFDGAVEGLAASNSKFVHWR